MVRKSFKRKLTREPAGTLMFCRPAGACRPSPVSSARLTVAASVPGLATRIQVSISTVQPSARHQVAAGVVVPMEQVPQVRSGLYMERSTATGPYSEVTMVETLKLCTVSPALKERRE